MKIDDFGYMWRGKQLDGLTQKQAHLLAPVNICGPGKERALFLLLLHGFSSSPAVYRRLIPALAPAYDAIVCPALPGHGESIAAFTRVNAIDWVSATEQVCEGLMSNFRHVDALGLS